MNIEVLNKPSVIQNGVSKGPFIATRLNSTRRRVELSCVALNGP